MSQPSKAKEKCSRQRCKGHAGREWGKVRGQSWGGSRAPAMQALWAMARCGEGAGGLSGLRGDEVSGL